MNEITYISLTTIPPRFENIGKTLECLLNQKAEIFEFCLVIPKIYSRFPDWNGDLPQVPRGIKLLRCEKDLGPACKLFPTLHSIENIDSYVLYCDDDWEYQPMWAQTFINNKLKNNSVIASSTFKVERLGKKNGSIVQGFGGVLVQKRFFTAEDYNIPSPYRWVDDIWISTCLRKNMISVEKNKQSKQFIKNGYRDNYELQNATFLTKKRAELNLAAVNYSSDRYKIWI